MTDESLSVVAKKRVLYFNNQEADYLADCILIGLLHQPNFEIYQFPVKKILFQKFAGSSTIRGNGFTLYHLLKDQLIRSVNSNVELNLDGKYDLIVFSSIHRQFDAFIKYLPQLKGKNVWILDGEDTPALYPFHGYFWRRPLLWFLPKAHNRFLYFKREWTPETIHYLCYKLIPRSISKLLPPPKNLRPISFSIPESKICKRLPKKTKLFPLHIVDEEVAAHVEGSFTGYAFKSEQDYYTDLQHSRYGITTKRSGWDCLRHYEIAANGAVICFRDLDKKPVTCAPHGLVDGVNCISYSSYGDLINRINRIDEDGYLKLQASCIEWAKKNTCENSVLNLIRKYTRN
jgi:hypothetical protein